jgi:hypothetical protein
MAAVIFYNKSTFLSTSQNTRVRLRTDAIKISVLLPVKRVNSQLRSHCVSFYRFNSYAYRVWVCVCVYVCIDVCMYVCMYVYVCVLRNCLISLKKLLLSYINIIT